VLTLGKSARVVKWFGADSHSSRWDVPNRLINARVMFRVIEIEPRASTTLT